MVVEFVNRNKTRETFLNKPVVVYCDLLSFYGGILFTAAIEWMRNVRSSNKTSCESEISFC